MLRAIQHAEMTWLLLRCCCRHGSDLHYCHHLRHRSACGDSKRWQPIHLSVVPPQQSTRAASHEDGASRVRAPGVLMPHAWGLLPLPAPLRRQLQVRLACHAACSAAVRHEVSRHCLLLSCTHVALTVLLSFICQVLQGREGARHQREIQEWPFPGVSLSRVLGRSRGACVRVCCVPPMPARFQGSLARAHGA